MFSEAGGAGKNWGSQSCRGNLLLPRDGFVKSGAIVPNGLARTLKYPHWLFIDGQSIILFVRSGGLSSGNVAKEMEPEATNL